MSPAKVTAVRQPLKAREGAGRTLDQRLFVRFPRLGRAMFRLAANRPPRSRLRRAGLARAAQISAEAYNRRDLDAVVIGYHPELEYRPARAWVEGGFFEPCYHGPDGYRKYVASTAEVFGGEVYFMPEELVDLGDRFVMLARVPMRAQASGIELTETFAYVAHMKDGLVIRMQEYYDHDEALAAAGLN
jgi:ketosteroid isomerase-like protein